MTDPTKLERRPDLRCQDTDVETEGRTHYCKLTANHEPHEHRCICARSWGEAKVKS